MALEAKISGAHAMTKGGSGAGPLAVHAPLRKQFSNGDDPWAEAEKNKVNANELMMKAPTTKGIKRKKKKNALRFLSDSDDSDLESSSLINSAKASAKVQRLQPESMV